MEKLDNVKEEIRSLDADVKNGKVSAADGLKKLEELRAQKSQIEKEIAEASHPVETRANDLSNVLRDVKNAMIEKRAITIGSNGAINQIKDIYKVILAKTPVLNGVKKFNGPDAETQIPLLQAYPVVNGKAEGVDVDADGTAKFDVKKLTPHAFVSLLPVTAEAIKMGIVNFETEAPALFADAFAQMFHTQILAGDGKDENFKGIFGTTVEDANKTTGAITLAKLAELALSVQDKLDSTVLIMNPAVYSKFMADTSTDETTKLYKESLIRDKSIEGVKIMLTSAAPSAVTAGSTIAVAMDLNNYGMAIADEIVIDPIKKVGDTHTYFQATAFANGDVIQSKNVWSFVVGA